MKVFLINLDRSTDRLEKCKAEFARFNLSFERIPAVYGADLTEQEFHQHYDESLNQQNYFKQLTKGEVGCFLSHRTAWQRIVDEKLDYAVILEDDFVIQGDIQAALADIENLKDDWHYIKLAGYGSKKRRSIYSKQLAHFERILFEKVPAGTCAQAVSFEGATRLLQSTNKFGRPIDVDLQYWWEKNVQISGLKPFPIRPNEDEESVITQMANRSKIKKHKLKRLKQQLSFKLRNYLERNKQSKTF